MMEAHIKNGLVQNNTGNRFVVMFLCGP